jgi:hypothetical protein
MPDGYQYVISEDNEIVKVVEGSYEYTGMFIIQ